MKTTQQSYLNESYINSLTEALIGESYDEVTTRYHTTVRITEYVYFMRKYFQFTCKYVETYNTTHSVMFYSDVLLKKFNKKLFPVYFGNLTTEQRTLLSAIDTYLIMNNVFSVCFIDYILIMFY